MSRSTLNSALSQGEKPSFTTIQCKGKNVLYIYIYIYIYLFICNKQAGRHNFLKSINNNMQYSISFWD